MAQCVVEFVGGNCKLSQLSRVHIFTTDKNCEFVILVIGLAIVELRPSSSRTRAVAANPGLANYFSKFGPERWRPISAAMLEAWAIMELICSC